MVMTVTRYRDNVGIPIVVRDGERWLARVSGNNQYEVVEIVEAEARRTIKKLGLITLLKEELD